MDDPRPVWWWRVSETEHEMIRVGPRDVFLKDSDLNFLECSWRPRRRTWNLHSNLYRAEQGICLRQERIIEHWNIDAKGDELNDHGANSCLSRSVAFLSFRGRSSVGCMRIAFGGPSSG